MMDDRIHEEKELQKLLPVAVISEIPAIAVAADEREASVGGCGWDGRQRFSYLLRFCWGRHSVTSAVSGIAHVQSLLQLEAQSV